MRQPKGTRGSERANRRVHFLVLRVFRRFRDWRLRRRGGRM